MKPWRAGWLVGAGLLVLAWGYVTPVLAQDVICCMRLIAVNGNWFGAIRTCDLSNLPPAQRAKICQEFAGCADTAPYCGVDRPCTETGSLIDIQNQALGEKIAVSGTPFSLYYRSDRTGGSRAGDGFPNSLAGWSLGVHHAYDTGGKILYTGDGRRRIAAVGPGPAGGEIRIPSEDGTVVDIFDGKGRHLHLRTVNSLTGAVRHRFDYDAQARLVGIEDGYRNTTRIERDARGVPTGIVAPGGQRTVLTTHPDGHLASVTNPAGETTRLSYSKDGRLSELTDPKEQVHRYTYSSQGALLKDENPAGGHWALARTQTPNGFRVALSSALGRTSTYEIERLSTGDEHRVNTGPGGAAVRVEKDTKGNGKVTDPDGTVSASEFQPDPRWGALAPFVKSFSMSTPGGRTLRVSAERKADLTQPVTPPVAERGNPLGALAPFLRGLPLPAPARDLAGILAERKAAPAQPGEPSNLRSLTESLTVNGRGYRRIFDVSKMEWTQTTPAGRQVITSLNAQERVVRRAVPGTLPVSFVYDSSGRLSGIGQGTGAQSRTVTVGYDAEGRIARIVDPLKNATRFEYDPAGRLAARVASDGRRVSYRYDAAGKLLSITPPARPAHRFEYSPVGQLRGYAPPSSQPGAGDVAYDYNADKQLTRIAYSGVRALGLGYDPAGRLDTVEVSGRTLRLTYDAANRLTSTADGDQALTYGYDGPLLTSQEWDGMVKGRVSTRYDDNLRVVSHLVGDREVKYAYDADGLVVGTGDLMLQRDGGHGLVTGTTLHKVTTTHRYNGFGELARLAVSFEGKEMFVLELERDALGRTIRSREMLRGKETTAEYGYDASGRLALVTRDGTRTTRYEYDPNGNRVGLAQHDADRMTTAYDDQDRLVAQGDLKFQYDPSGQLAARQARNGSAKFDYDALGNLMKVTLPGSSAIDYLVDGAGRRIGRRQGGVLQRGLLYQDLRRPIAELDQGGKPISLFGHATGDNAPDYLIREGRTYRVIADDLGSPRLVIDTATGEIAQQLDYDEYGVVRRDTAPGFQPFGFAGGLYDPATGLVRFGARDYDASTGRWTAPDPLAFAGRETNLYEYGGGDPVNRRDPSGLQSQAPTLDERADAWLRRWQRDHPYGGFLPPPQDFRPPDNPATLPYRPPPPGFFRRTFSPGPNGFAPSDGLPIPGTDRCYLSGGPSADRPARPGEEYAPYAGGGDPASGGTPGVTSGGVNIRFGGP